MGELSQSKLKEYFGRFGSVRAISIPTGINTGERRGHAFVTFSSAEEAKKAVAEGFEANIDGTDIFYRLNEEAGASMQEVCTIIVKNIGELSGGKLKGYFGKFGSVRMINFPTARSGNRKGFAQVTFSNAEEAKKAVAEGFEANIDGT